MSMREARLCDQGYNYGGGMRVCGKLAIGTCVLCEHDLCEEHAPHPDGSTIIQVVSRTRNRNEKVDVPVQDFKAPLMFCFSCNNKYRIPYLAGGTDNIMQALVKTFIEHLRAKLAAESL